MDMTERVDRRTRLMRQVEEQAGEPIADLLRRLYYEDHLTMAEISAKISVPLGTLGGWMIRLGLDRASVATKAMERAS